MRSWLSASVFFLFLGAMVGYAVHGNPVEAQAKVQPFAIGETITIVMGANRLEARCTVTALTPSGGTFFGCKDEQGREVWYNLAFVETIKK